MCLSTSNTKARITSRPFLFDKTLFQSYLFWSALTCQRLGRHRLVDALFNKLVTSSNQYKWCSAIWFETHTSKAHYETVTSLNIDSIRIRDDF